jgi:hypothetical protein
LFNTPRDPDYAAGWNARLDGKQRVDNPHASPIYENDYGRRLAWLFGWDDADYAIRCAEES